jgi:hypothetical protein
MRKIQGYSLVVLLVASTSACFWERVESSYSSLGEAQRSGAIDKGWIPAWLPPSATDIRELHDIDTNESMLVFASDATHDWELPGDCQPVSYLQVPSPRLSRRWWPAPELLERSYDFHRCKGDVPFSTLSTWIGRHKSGERGVHWRAHAR